MGLVQHHAVKGSGDGLQVLPCPAFHTAQKFSLGERVSRLLLGIPIAAGLYGFIMGVLHLPRRSILQGLNRKARALFVGLPGFPPPQGLCLAEDRFISRRHTTPSPLGAAFPQGMAQREKLSERRYSYYG